VGVAVGVGVALPVGVEVAGADDSGRGCQLPVQSPYRTAVKSWVSDPLTTSSCAVPS
jgi:hypothetical protein